ncbi:hypothetical protein [Halobacteriovorax sp. HLS]|uniref:hypothetical protein n=1 Tax=Halobacteriovorax sp. HLS TaxID=2234000 RepID=UPI000FDC3E68|nr:hypothetical protein [Halobacteriovorax sp. HLS]
MKMIIGLFILFSYSQLSFASEDFCFSGMEDTLILKQFQLKSNMKCETKDALITALSAGTLTLGTVTALCTWAPEPAITKISAAVIATSGLIINYATFLVRNMPCNSSGKRELEDYEKTEILEKVCKSINKKLNLYTETCE